MLGIVIWTGGGNSGWSGSSGVGLGVIVAVSVAVGDGVVLRLVVEVGEGVIVCVGEGEEVFVGLEVVMVGVEVSV